MIYSSVGTLHGILGNMNTEAFQTAYNRLNLAQKQAVDTIEGPVMVIAGPGTGKTQILTLRIANILRLTDTQPENILALTFTESGARAMRERLAMYIGAPAYRVRIHTFHEFAGECIRTYPDAYERAVGGRPITDLEKITLIETILETPAIKLLRPSGNPQFYVNPIMHALSLMKREYITPDRFVEIIRAQEELLNQTPKLHEKGAHIGKVRGEYIEREKTVLKNRELLFIYKAYEAALEDNKYFDFDDMIFETVHAMETKEDMLRSLQETYQYILADEHQDVNGSQNKMLELLASYHDRPNLFVVGDEKQSIFRFQGASLENFVFFEEKFPHTKTISLTENYRSLQSILDLAHELILVNAGAALLLRVPLTATKKGTPVITRSTLSHEAVEHDMLVTQVASLLTEKVPPEEIAIIVRTNKEVEELAGHLRRQGISAEASADGDILSHPITESVRTLISIIIDPQNEAALFMVLQSAYVGLSLSDLVKITKSQSYAHRLAAIIQDHEFLAGINVEGIAQVERLGNMIQGARERMQAEAPHRVLEYILKESGFFDFVLGAYPYEGARVLRRLYDEVEELVRHGEATNLSSIEAMFKTRMLHTLPITAPYIHASRHAVQVMTAHKAKGLEFEHVFIPHLTDGKWGGRRHMEYFTIPITAHTDEAKMGHEDDERKLLYVALTRAKSGLHLSSSETNSEGRSFLPTRLLEHVGESSIVEEDVSSYEEGFDPMAGMLPHEQPLDLDSDLLKETLRVRGISATALNNYLKSPWNYFYRNVLRLPEVQPESAQFGTALHDSLRSVMKHRREEGSLPSPTQCKTYLERELGKMPLTENEYTRLHERAFLALTAYIAYITPTLPHETKEEYKLTALLQTGDPEFPEILLTGQLDRLDFDTDGKLVCVVDYKSGKARTRGYIEGTTKDSNGDYKRQLTFYALLLSLQEDTRLHSKEGLLSFVEADEKGKIHEEAYTITDAEIEELKKEIIRVALEIVHGAFLNAPCDPAASDYCHLVSELRKSRD